MFWNNFVYYCNLHNVKPNNVTKAIGMSSAAATDWKKGSQPRDTALLKLAEYFGITVEDLTCDNETLDTPPSTNKLTPTLSVPQLSEHECRVLLAYRDQPEMQPAVDRLLGITEDGYVTVYAAANSASNHKHTITRIPQEKWAEIENEPNTDEDLM